MSKIKKKKKEKDIMLTNHFLIDNIINNRLNSRSLSFYKKKYKLYMSISLIFAILTFTLSSFGYYTIIDKNKYQKTFITNTLGQTQEYEQTKERTETIRDTIQYQNRKK
jgi:hypothetical protein